MSTIQKLSESDKALATQILAYKDDYQTVWNRVAGNDGGNTPILQTKPVSVPMHSFSEHPAFTDEKTTIFSAVQIGFIQTAIKLFRLKWDVVIGYDDSRRGDLTQELANILTDIDRIYDAYMYQGITPNYGLKNNTNTILVPGTATTANDFVNKLTTQLMTMVATLGSGAYSIVLPFGWYSKFAPVQNLAPDVYIKDTLKSRAAGMGVTLSIYESLDLDTEVFIIRNSDLTLYHGLAPQTPKSINDDVREMLHYRYIFDTTAFIIARKGAVAKMTGLLASNESLTKHRIIVPQYKFTPKANKNYVGKNPKDKDEEKAE